MLESNWKRPATKRFLELYSPGSKLWCPLLIVEYDDSVSRRRQKKSPSPVLPYFPFPRQRSKSDWDLSDLDLMFEGAVATNTLMTNGRNDDGIHVTELSNAEKRNASELVPRNIPSIKSIALQGSKDVIAESERRAEEVGLDTVEQVVQVPNGKNQGEETEILRPEHTQADVDYSEEALPDRDDHLDASIPDHETESTDPAQGSNKLNDDTKMDSQEPSTVTPSPQIESGQLSQSANIIPKLPVQQPCLGPLTTVTASTVQLPSAENELVQVSVLTNMENAIESMDSVITALSPIAVSEIMQDVPVTTPAPKQLDNEDTVSAGASQNVSEVPSVPLTNLLTDINESPHISQVVETVTTPKEIGVSSTNSDEQLNSIAMDGSILSPPHDTAMDIDIPDTSQTVDHANCGPSDCEKVITNDKIVLDVVSDQVSPDVVDPKGFQTSKTFEKDDYDSTPKSSRKTVSLDGSAADAADPMEEATVEIVEQLSSAFVASLLTPHSETDGQQHTPTRETPFELVVDNNLKMLTENASTESPSQNELPELVDKSSQLNKSEVEVSKAAGSLLQEQEIIRPEEPVDQCLEKKQTDAIDSGLDMSVKFDVMKGVMIVDKDLIQQIVAEEVDSMQPIIPDDGDPMQEAITESVEMAMKDSGSNDDISAGEREYVDPINQSPSEKTTPPLEAVGLVQRIVAEDIESMQPIIPDDGDPMQEAITESVEMAMKDSGSSDDISAGEREYVDPINLSPGEKTTPPLEAVGLVQQILAEDIDSMQPIIPDNGDSMQDVVSESVEMAMKDSDSKEDISAGEREYLDPINQSPNEKTAPPLEAVGIKSLNQDIFKESRSIDDDVNQNLSSNDNTSISSANPSYRSVSLPSWSAPIPPIPSPPNSKSLPIAPLSRQQSPISSRAPIPRASSPIPEHLSSLVRRYISPARDLSPVRPPSSTRDLTPIRTPIRDVSPIKDASPARVLRTPRRTSSRIISCREPSAVVITVPLQTQTITPLPAEYSTTEDTNSTSLTLPRIKIKFNESPKSSTSPPPAKRQKVSHPNTKGIFDCIVVRSDFENVLPKVIVSNM
jgi:hypothetical protein